MSKKDDAFVFLKGLEQFLNSSLPSPSEMSQKLEALNKDAKKDKGKAHLRGREAGFINGFATPLIFQALMDQFTLTWGEAKTAFLSESYSGLSEYCSGTPARRLRHPFNKALNVSALSVYEQWSGMGTRTPLTQSCPDFAFRHPCPYKIIFEGKYSHKGGPSAAQSTLVGDSYQAFFYRALPPDHDGAGRPDWDYDYSCLFAYDGTREGSLFNAWGALAPKVKSGFWQGASVFVMVLRGHEI